MPLLLHEAAVKGIHKYIVTKAVIASFYFSFLMIYLGAVNLCLSIFIIYLFPFR